MTSFGSQQSRKKEDAVAHSSKNSSKGTESRSSPQFRDVLVGQFLDKTGIVHAKHRMASSSSSSSDGPGGLQLAPLRPIDDFILGSARFQLPNFSDWEKWGNRVVKNLLYYQTNYLLVIGVWLVLTLVYQPKVVIYSTSIIGGSLLAAYYCVGQYGTPQLSDRGNLKYLLGTILPGFALLYLMDLIVFVLFVILVPFCSEFCFSPSVTEEFII